jgi:hypothetical protein
MILWMRNSMVLAGALVAALGLAWMGLDRHVVRSCMLNQWPHLQSCPSVGDPKASVRELRERIARNPGDVVAYLALATLAQSEAGIDGLDADALVEAVGRVAPNDPTTLRVRVNHAILKERWPEAAKGMIALLQQSADNGQAARGLAQLLGRGQGLDEMRAALVQGRSGWFEAVLRQLGPAGVPVSAAMPLVSTAIARGALTPESGLVLVRELKAARQWRDAHAIWLRLWNRPIEALFNGGFDQGFVADGFDWEVLESSAPSRAGAVVRQPNVSGRGRVLQLDFTGRALASPMIRQYVVLLSGSYRLTGQFMADKWRSADGLLWVVSCANDRRELGRSAPLLGTDGAWKAFQIDFRAPFECDGGLVLELRAASAVDTAGGMRGVVAFDALSLQPLASKP